jgi:hypothetical protein
MSGIWPQSLHGSQEVCPAEDDIIQIKVPGKKERQFDGTFYDYGEISFHVSTLRHLETVDEIIENQPSTWNLSSLGRR